MTKLTIHHSPFTMRGPFTVFHESLLKVNSKRKVNGELLMVNGAEGA